jgi:hypothetical protein
MTRTDTSLSPQLADALRRITERGLSRTSRVGHVALLLLALGMGVVIAALLATEPRLPAHTVAAFAVMLAIAVAWVAYATWVLRNRLTLMAQHRVIAGWMAVAFCAMFSAAALSAGVVAQSAAGFVAAATGVGLLVAALLLLRRAKLSVDELQRKRAQVEAEIARR